MTGIKTIYIQRINNMDYQSILLSLKVGLVSTAAAIPLGILTAMVLVKSRLPFKNLIDAAVNIPLVLPPLATGYLLLLLFGRNGLIGGVFYRMFGLQIPFTWIAAVIAALVVSFPLMVRTLKVTIEAIDPRLEDAARTLGAGRLDVFFTVTLPLSLKGIIAGSVLTFARSIGEFGATIIFAGNIADRTRTLPLAMFHYINLPGGEQNVNYLMWIAIAVSLLAMLAANRLTEKTGYRK